MITDSKIFTLNGARNSQNDVQWALSKEEVKNYPKDQFPKSVHVYGGMSHIGLTKLIYVNGNITGKKYVEDILPKLTIEIQNRTKLKGKVNEIKLFEKKNEFIFEQDHAKSHDSNISQDWCTKNLKYFLNKNDTPAKMDDYWPIERLWAIMTSKVYKEPRPDTIPLLKRRINKCWAEISQHTLVKLVHQMPLRLKWISENQGKKIVDFKGQCSCVKCNNVVMVLSELKSFEKKNRSELKKLINSLTF